MTTCKSAFGAAIGSARSTHLALYIVAMIVAGAVASFSFDWKFVFLVCLFFCLVTVGHLLFAGGSWWTLAKVWAALALFQSGYFVGLLAQVWRDARQARRLRETARRERGESHTFDRIDVS